MDPLDTLSIVNVLDDHKVVDAKPVVLAKRDGLVAGDGKVYQLVLSAVNLRLGHSRRLEK